MWHSSLIHRSLHKAAERHTLTAGALYANKCVQVTQIYEDGMLLRGELFQQLFVRRVIGRGSGGDRLPEQVLLGEELPDLAAVLPRNACQRRQRR